MQEYQFFSFKNSRNYDFQILSGLNILWAPFLFLLYVCSSDIESESLRKILCMLNLGKWTCNLERFLIGVNQKKFLLNL